ncbi:putative toxin-antitoxin system toxin component, PIN family [bacterium]|nr:putative toxin-antitoxin system toxin component, PIN family [bacterium]
MIKVVPDTNVLISAIVFGGNPRNILGLAIEGKIQFAVSEFILNETKQVLIGKKFKYQSAIPNLVIDEIRVLSDVVVPCKKIHLIKKDIYDNFILECAIESKADFVITGDSHLLDLTEYRNVKILTPSDFLKLI